MGSERSADSTRASPARSASRPDANTSGDSFGQLGDKCPQMAWPPDIPVPISDLIEQERQRLRQASTVLSCLKIAALYQAWHEEIDASDVAVVVQTLVDKAINRLDIVELARSAKNAEALQGSEGAPNEDV